MMEYIKHEILKKIYNYFVGKDKDDIETYELEKNKIQFNNISDKIEFIKLNELAIEKESSGD